MLSSAGSVSVLSNVDGTNTVASTTSASTSSGLGLSSLAVTSTGVTIAGKSTLTLSAAAANNDAVTFTSSTGAATTFTFKTTLTGAANELLASGTLATDATALAVAINTANGSSVAASTAGAVTLSGGGKLSGAPAGATTYTSAQLATTGDTVTFTGSAANSAAQVFTFKTTATATGAANEVILGGTQAQTMTNLAAVMKTAGISASSSNGLVTAIGGSVTSGTPASTGTSTVSNGAASILLMNNAISKIGVTLSALGSATTQLTGLSDFMSKLQTSVKTSLGAMVDANLSDESAKLAPRCRRSSPWPSSRCRSPTRAPARCCSCSANAWLATA